MQFRYLLLIIAVSLFVCNGLGMAEENGSEKKEFKTCPEPRPQMCTREYRPVCAKLDDGSMKTYSNGCTACTNPKAVGFYSGACEE